MIRSIVPSWQTLMDEQFPRALRDRLVELRRAIHAEPELAYQEHRTSERLEQALVELVGGDVKSVAGTGLTLRIPGRSRHAPTVAIRGDIDALPIQEETGLSFASQTPGVMHACGHDIHATWAVGAGALLAAEPAEGDVVILLQPAEETGGGAARMIAAGALDGVAMIFGGHVDRRFPVGQIVADDGPVAASADAFEIVMSGRGAHAARPHESSDPIVAAAALVGALQQVVSRRMNPGDAGVLTVATIHAGMASNVIPERATLTGTVRALRPEVRGMMRRELEQVVAGVALAHDVSGSVEYSDSTPPVVNDAVAAGYARTAVTSLLGGDALAPLGFLNMASEDFAHYLERIPGCFLRIGAREEGGTVIPAHSSMFAPAEESIFVGAAVLAEAARVASRALAASLAGLEGGVR